MRVLAVANLYPPHHLGGYELICESAVHHLRAAGHDVRVLTSDHRVPDPEPWVADAEQDVHRELRLYWRDDGWPRVAPLARLRMERGNARALDRHVRGFRPDVVSWWGMAGMSLSLIERASDAGLPASGVVCDDWLLYGPDVDQWTAALEAHPRAAPLVRAATRSPGLRDPGAAASWVFLSEHLRERALARWHLPRTEVAHRGPDTELFAPAAPGPWRWRLAYIGRIDPRKGIEIAIRALPLLPAEATLSVEGPGDRDHLADLTRLAAELAPGRVRFGRLSRPKLRNAYAGADAVLFPVTWNEPWGLVPLEAMSVGRPVVATGRGGSGEYLRDEENCLLFDPDAGADALAAALERLAGDEGLRARLREGGEATVSSLDPRRFNEAVEHALAAAARP